jgi:hypothetical protein
VQRVEPGGEEVDDVEHRAAGGGDLAEAEEPPGSAPSWNFSVYSTALMPRNPAPITTEAMISQKALRFFPCSAL